MALAGSAGADDAKQPLDLKNLKIEPWTDPVPAAPADKQPGIGGVDALGKILVPPDHPDARLWPDGMWIAPPDTGDRNVLVPGSNQLPWWKPQRDAGPLSKQLLDGFETGVGSFLELLVPPSS